MKTTATQNAKDWLAELAIDQTALLLAVLIVWAVVRAGRR